MKSSMNGVGASSMRPCASAAASSEPAAMPIAKNRLIAVATSTPPPMRDLMMTGTSDSVIAPDHPEPAHRDRQPTQWRSSAFSSRRIARVAVKGL